MPQSNSMHLRHHISVLVATTVLVGLTACSTSKEAESGEQAATTQQAQTAQQADEQADELADEQQTEEADTPADKQQMMMQACPMQLEGTTRKLVKLDDAVAMDFTTTGDVDALRQRVEKMGQMHTDGGMHGQMHGEKGRMKHGQMHGEKGRMKPGQMTEEQRQRHQQMMQMMSDVTVETEEIEGGMRMKMTPEEPEQVDRLYQMMQQQTQMMEKQGQQCPMMQMMGGGPVDEPSE